MVLVGHAVILRLFSYDQMVDDFAGMGVPAPGLMVPVVGIVEFVAVFAAILGLRRLAFAVTVTMVVAAIVDGPTPVAVAALVAVLGLVVLDTGAFSLWQPEARYLPRLSSGTR